MSIPFYEKIKNISLARLFFLVFGVIFFCAAFCFSGCKKNIDYFSYVSELRNNIFIAENEEFSLRIHSVIKEVPYAADGIAHEQTALTEIYLIAPNTTKNYQLKMQVGEKEYGGELSFDNVKTEYFLSFSLNISNLKELTCDIIFEDSVVSLTAISVLHNETLSPKEILSCVQAYNPNVFTNLTDKYGFAGEIHLRLLYEDSPYYYVGVINRSGDIHAFLVNATNGKVLAERTP